MISRKSTLAIAEAYDNRFVYRGRSDFTYHKDALYDFLYENEFDAYLLNAFRAIPGYEKRGLKDYIQRLHTGESIAANTTSFTWEQRQLLGQRILKDLAECLIRTHNAEPKYDRNGNIIQHPTDLMRNALELDGYIFREGRLWVPEESVIEEAEEQGILDGLMTSLHLSDIPTLKHHLELSGTHYSEARWDDSISNSRKFLEGTLAQAAARLLVAQPDRFSPKPRSAR